MPTEPTSQANSSLGDPSLRRSLEDFVRRRVPAADVDDVVQTVLCDALAAPHRPSDPAELKRWLLGIARHKVVDHHRRAHREPSAELADIEASPAPIEERELARWAERQAGEERDAKKTLAWMAREGEGEKLESIAAEERVPAARVRQRVSRMRRWMKERWAAELAAVAMLAALALVAYWLLRKPSADPVTHDNGEPLPTIDPEPIDPLLRARSLRADALRACDRSEWRACLDGLDEARTIDPEGDRAPSIGAARARAEAALAPVAPSASVVPVAPSAPVVPIAPSTPSFDPPLDAKESDADLKKDAPIKKGEPVNTTPSPTPSTTSSVRAPATKPKPVSPKSKGSTASSTVLDSDRFGDKKPSK